MTDRSIGKAVLTRLETAVPEIDGLIGLSGASNPEGERRDGGEYKASFPDCQVCFTVASTPAAR